MNIKNSDKNSESIKLFLTTCLLVAFTVTAVGLIIAWVPLLPEAIAVDIKNPGIFSDYIGWHHSWHTMAATSIDTACLR